MSSLLNLPPETYQTILESLPAAVYLVDLNRRIILWNDGCERITGYMRYEVIGHCCADDLLMHCNENNDIMCGDACPLLDTMHDGAPRQADVFLRHKDGQRVPVRVRAIPVRDEEGFVIGACECFDERVHLLPARPNPQLVDLPGFGDEVTQLPGREASLRCLAAGLREFRASHIPFGVLCLAIDHLEELRTADGSIAMNDVLYAAAQTLEKAVGPGNMVGRWSERRFVATVGACTEATLLESAAILKRVAGLDAVPWWGDRLRITLSAGGTMARAEDTPEELVRRAEEALEEAMKNGLSQATVV